MTDQTGPVDVDAPTPPDGPMTRLADGTLPVTSYDGVWAYTPTNDMAADADGYRAKVTHVATGRGKRFVDFDTARRWTYLVDTQADGDPDAVASHVLLQVELDELDELDDGRRRLRREVRDVASRAGLTADDVDRMLRPLAEFYNVNAEETDQTGPVDDAVDADPRCPGMAMTPEPYIQVKRCVRHRGHVESCLWLEALNVVGRPPILLVWDGVESATPTVCDVHARTGQPTADASRRVLNPEHAADSWNRRGTEPS